MRNLTARGMRLSSHAILRHSVAITNHCDEQICRSSMSLGENLGITVMWDLLLISFLVCFYSV